MTRIDKTKSAVRRITSALYRRRELCVELHPQYVEIWEKGRRDRLSVRYDSIYEFALKIRFRQQEAEKKGKRKKGGSK